MIKNGPLYWLGRVPRDLTTAIKPIETIANNCKRAFVSFVVMGNLKSARDFLSLFNMANRDQVDRPKGTGHILTAN